MTSRFIYLNFLYDLRLLELLILLGDGCICNDFFEHLDLVLLVAV